MKRARSIAAAAVILLAISAGTAGFLAGSSAEVARAAPDFSLEIDTGPIGNTGDALGPTETCVEVGAGESFVVDVVAKDAPGLAGVEISIDYNPQVLQVTGIQVNGLFLGKNGGSVFNLSSPTPDEDGSYRPAAFEFNDTRPSGNGTVFRVVFETKEAGISPLQIPVDDTSTFFYEGPVIPDPNSPDGQPGFTPLLAGGEVRVGQACPSGTAPPAPARPADLGVVLEQPTTPDTTPPPATVPTPGPAERTPVATVTPKQNGASDDNSTSPGGSASGSDSGTDLTDMPWLALWVALGALAIGGSGGALLRLLVRRMR